MKNIFVLFVFLALFSVTTISCSKSKCQTCTTTTTQVVMGVEQKTSVSKEYCGDKYDDAPAEGTVNNNLGIITQEVVVSCN